MVTKLPLTGSFSTRASKGISREGTFFFQRPGIPKTCSKIKTVCGAQVIFVSRGADLGINR